MYLLDVNDGVLVAKEIQGEIKTAPRSGSERVKAGTDGWGWEIWESRASARFAPAESPVRMIEDGGMLSVFRTWERRADACVSCLG